MASRTQSIHSGGPGMSILRSFRYQTKHFFFRSHYLFCKPLNVHALANVFSDLQVAQGRFEQVENSLVVYLEETAFDQENQFRAVVLGCNHLLLLFNAVEDVLKRPLHDASLFLLHVHLLIKLRSLNCVCLACSCLTVRKDCSVVSLHARVSYWFCDVIKY